MTHDINLNTMKYFDFKIHNGLHVLVLNRTEGRGTQYALTYTYFFIIIIQVKNTKTVSNTESRLLLCCTL